METHVIEDDEVCNKILELLHHRVVEGLVGDGEVKLAGHIRRASADVLPASLEVSLDGALRIVVAVLGLCDDRVQVVGERFDEVLRRLGCRGGAASVPEPGRSPVRRR